ncbi:hypothetical protein [Empedobacter brevis]|uniref:hypothetical protein n=1 Tax=Empedobacter brevis TaxID=247 RepID=UPI00289AE314|nr:hypothetical protein [Empedobacter brevis]
MEKQQQSYTEKSTLKNWFRSKLKPTQGQFWAWMDSYWHKGEKLPINTIDGLGEAVDGKAPLVHYHEHYATNDASSLADDNVLSWKQKLGVDDLDYVEIPTENATENSHPYVVVINDEGKSAKQNANDFGKVDTVNEIEPDENKNVNIGLDDVLSKGSITERTVSFKNGETQNFDVGLLKESLLFRYNDPNEIKETTLSSDFSIGAYQNYYWVSSTGKNVVAASSVQMGFLGTQPDGQIIGFQFADRRNNVLRLVADINTNTYETNSVKYPAKSGVNALISDIQAIFNQATNWTHSLQRFSGLVSKHNDATYNRLLGMDANGNLNEVGLPALTNEMSKATDMQKDAYRLASRKTDEQYSLGQPQIDIIYPPVLKRQDAIVTITAMGTNLFINNSEPNTSKVVMVNVSTGQRILISNPEVNQNNPSVISFRYNFNDLPFGDYHLEVEHNGIMNIDTSKFTLVETLDEMPIPILTWQSVIIQNQAPIPNELISFSDNGFSFNDKINKPTTNPSIPHDLKTYVIQSSKIDELKGTDFYMEIDITIPFQPTNQVGQRHSTTSIGLCNFISDINTGNTFKAGVGIGNGTARVLLLGELPKSYSNIDPSGTLYIIRRGTSMNMGVLGKNMNMVTTYNETDLMLKLLVLNDFPFSPNQLISCFITKFIKL